MRSSLYSVLAATFLSCASLAGCAECERDFDCPGTKICSAEGACEAFVCAASSDCPPAQACTRNRCVSRSSPAAPPTPDAFIIEGPP